VVLRVKKIGDVHTVVHEKPYLVAHWQRQQTFYMHLLLFMLLIQVKRGKQHEKRWQILHFYMNV